MKASLLLFLLSISFSLFAQWTSSGSNIYPTTLANSVGIGTSNPRTKFHIYGADISSIGDLGFNEAFRITRKGISGGQQEVSMGMFLSKYDGTDGNSKTRVDFRLSNIGSPTNGYGTDLTTIIPVMSMLGNGNIGIGTSTPQTRLDLGELRFDKIAALPAEGSILEARWANYIIGDASNFQRLKLGVSNDGYTRAEISLDNSNRADGIIEFNTTNANGGVKKRMVIDGAGNVGIGTTTPQTKLDIDGLRLDSFKSFPEEGSIWEGKFPNYIIGDAEHQKLRLGVVNGGYTKAEIFLDNDNQVYGTIRFKTTNTFSGSQTRMFIDGAGNVGIGTGDATPDAKLAVNGQIHATEVRVTATVPGPDYVFEKDYALPSLETVKTYIDQNKHLPEVPSAKEMEANGINLSEMNMLLLKKLEELTLYVIEQQKEIEILKSKIK